MNGSVEIPPESWKGCCLSIGNFDGVHMGHRALLGALARMASRNSAPAVVLTFHPHPAEALGRGRPQRLLPIEDRVRMLRALGADGVWVLPFDREMAGLSADGFVDRYLVERLAVRGVVVGPDFRFGAGREGNASLLAWHGHRHGFEVVQVPPLERDGERVSSSAVRRLLIEGKVEAAGRLLGRPYRVKGTVVRGMQVGTRLGFPTANLALDGEALVPANGIYVVRVRLGPSFEKSLPLEGVANVGNRPTVDNGPLAVEAHLFDVREPLYGRSVALEFLVRLRDEKRFPDVEGLKAAIAEDVRAAREHFRREKGT